MRKWARFIGMETRLGAAPARLRGLPSWLVNQVALSAERLATAALADVGAHRRQFAMLATLAEYGPISQIELARRCGIDQSDIVAALDGLEAGGMVTRSPDPSDRRRKSVAIRPAGRARLEQLGRVLDGVQDELLSSLTPAERDQLVALLARVIDRASSSDEGYTT
jgi:DNA-binding MarR family transcriptional regulator